MVITGTCKICGGKPVFDVGSKEQKEIEAFLKRAEFGHCSVGYHVEIGNMADYYVMDYTRRFASIQEAQQFIAEGERVHEHHYSSVRG